MKKLFELGGSLPSDVRAVRTILRVHVFTYVLGLTVLLFFSRNVPYLDRPYWQAATLVLVVLTFWLARSLSIQALTWWSSTTFLYATVRSYAYAAEGAYSPLGVWMLVITGISITALAVISVNALTGRLTPLR